MARTPVVREEVLADLIARAVVLGYDAAAIKRVSHDYSSSEGGRPSVAADLEAAAEAEHVAQAAAAELAGEEGSGAAASGE